MFVLVIGLLSVACALMFVAKTISELPAALVSLLSQLVVDEIGQPRSRQWGHVESLRALMCLQAECYRPNIALR